MDVGAMSQLSTEDHRLWRGPLPGFCPDRQRDEHRSRLHAVASPGGHRSSHRRSDPSDPLPLSLSQARNRAGLRMSSKESAGPPAIDAVGLGRDFGETRAVGALDFLVPAGAMVGLLGPN